MAAPKLGGENFEIFLCQGIAMQLAHAKINAGVTRGGTVRPGQALPLECLMIESPNDLEGKVVIHNG